MAGRPKNPNTDYKVILHQTGGYRYAATQPYSTDPVTGKCKRHYVYWGDVSHNKEFIPNQRFRLADADTRSRLIFPKDWNLSAIDELKKEKSSASDSVPVAENNPSSAPDSALAG